MHVFSGKGKGRGKGIKDLPLTKVMDLGILQARGRTMPGIAGAIYPEAEEVGDFVTRMMGMLTSCRGAGCNTHTYKNMQLGICGAQMARHNAIYVGLDGTLIRTESLRKHLEKRGYNVADANQSMLIALAYTAWGTTCLEYLDGDFAFFILDEEENHIILARDRIGKKPIYWYQDDKQFLFASEIKTLLASGSVPQTPALDAIASYLYFGFTPQDFTPLQNVSKLLPGHYLLCNNNGTKIVQPYWSYSAHFLHKTTDSFPIIVQRVSTLLQESIDARLPKKIFEEKQPLGCLVSGGLGSASVAYYLHHVIPPKHLNAYTEIFAEPSSQEDLQTASEVAKILNLEQFTGEITPETFLQDLVKIAWYLDEPLADPNIVGTWNLAALAASRSNMVFSGMGSDELLAGHERYTKEVKIPSFLEVLRQKLVDVSIPILKPMLLPIINLITRQGAYSILQQTRTEPWQFEYLNQNALFTQDMLDLAAPRIANFFDPHIFLHKFHNLPRIPSAVDSILYFDVKTRLPDCFILQYERFTSTHGLDWKTPYLSRPLIEYLASIPEPELLESEETFKILKEILKDVYPPNILQRPKKSRKDFLSSWVEESGVGDLFQKMTHGPLVHFNLISQSWLKTQLSTPAHRHASFRQLWGLLMLDIWFRLFITGPIRATPPDVTIRELMSEKI